MRGEHLAPPAKGVFQDHQDLLDPEEKLAKEESPDLLALLEQEVCLDPLVPQDHEDSQDRKAKVELLVNRARLARVDLRVNVGHKDNQEEPAVSDHQDNVDLQDREETLDHKGLLAKAVHLDSLETKEHEASLVLPEHLATVELKEGLDPRDHKGHEVQLDRQEIVGLRVRPELQESVDREDQEDLVVNVVHPVSLDHLGKLDH